MNPSNLHTERRGDAEQRLGDIITAGPHHRLDGVDAPIDRSKSMKVLICYHYFAHYRKPVLQELSKSQQLETELVSDFCAEQASLDTLRPEHFANGPEHLPNGNDEPKIRWHQVRNWWIGPFLWQRGLLTVIRRTDAQAIVFLGNAVFLSTWVAALIARLRGKRVYYWTHGLYGSEKRLKKFLRLALYRTANGGLLLYGHHAKQLLIQAGFPPEKLHVVYNSLDYQNQVSLRESLGRGDIDQTKREIFGDGCKYPIVMFVGRLMPIKKLPLLIGAVLRFQEEKQPVNLLIVGDGPKREELESLVPESLLPFVSFQGACHDEKKLCRLIHCADLCVSPGNVGLTAMHCLAFGTPVVTHGDMTWQMPEAEVIEEGINGGFFIRDNLDALCDAIKPWLDNSDQRRQAVRQCCVRSVEQNYTPKRQREIMERFLLDGLEES